MTAVTGALWAGGRLRDPREAALRGDDPGFATGLGVFETCGVVVRGGRAHAFALTRHLDRLAASLTALGLPAVDPDEVRTAVAAVLAAGLRGAGLRGAGGPGSGTPVVGRVRVTVSAGVPGERATLVVTSGPAPVRGAPHVVRSPWVRNERSPLTGHKSTSYAADVLALAAATRAGGDEALLANSVGALCEGTTSNVFVERDGALLTPALSSGCLPGVTRALVLGWAVAAGLPVREASGAELPWSVVADARRGDVGLALTGSLRGVVGVEAVEGTPTAVGPLTTEVARLFAARTADELDP